MGPPVVKQLLNISIGSVCPFIFNSGCKLFSPSLRSGVAAFIIELTILQAVAGPVDTVSFFCSTIEVIWTVSIINRR
jgi:hypothetical protein